MNILETQRLILRNTKEDDIEKLYEVVFSDENVVKHTFGSDLQTFDEVAEFIKQTCNFDKKLGLSTLIEKESGEIIGLAGVLECDYLKTKDYEFGFILGNSSWGKGFATEIGQAQIDYIRDEIKAKRVLALVYGNNIGSIKTIEKLGLKHFTQIETANRGSREVYLKDFEENK